MLDDWLILARRSQINSLIHLARTTTDHRAGIEAALTHGLSNAPVGSVNNKFRPLTCIAFGFRSVEALIALARLSLEALSPASRESLK